MANTFNHNGKVVITSGGNVGIGTDSPSSALDVSLSGGGTSGIRFKGYSDASTPYLLSLGTESYPDQFQIKSVNGLVTMGIVGATGAAPDLAFQTNTTERMRITSAGNVGIGTTSPVEKLDVRGGAYINGGTNDNAYDATLYVTANSSNDWGIFVSKPSHDYGIISQVANGSDFGFSVYDGTTHNFRVKGNGTTLIQGNVGIGTTSPAYKLDVDSGGAIEAARFYNSSYSATVVYIGDTGNSDYSDLILQSNSGAGEIFKAGTGYASWGGTLALNIYNSNGAIAFHPNGIANAMFINTSGNVGIGTTSPAQKLQVIGNAWINRPSNKVDNNGATEFGSRVEFNNSFASNESGYMVFQYPSYNNFLIGGDYDGHIGGGIPNIQFGRSNGTVYMHIASSNGNVGIGTTSPASKLQIGSVGSTGYSVGNGLAFGDGTRAGALNVESSGTNLYSSTNLIFSPGTTEAVRITSAGNVGIGTTSPATALDVVGTVTAYRYQAISSNASLVGYGVGTGLGIFNAGTDTLGFATASTERMRIDSTGNLMLGVTSVYGGGAQDAKFTMVGGAPAADAARGNMILMDTKAYNASPLFSIMLGGQFNSSNSTTFFGGIGAGKENATDNDYAGFLSLYTRANGAGRSEAVRITSAGNVGIGTTEPESKLHVAGGDVLISNGQYYTAESTTGGNYKLAGLTSGNVIVIGAIDYTSAGTIFAGGDSVSITTGGVAGSSRIYINSSGNVGIGTTSPTNKLQVTGGRTYLETGNEIYTLGISRSGANAYYLGVSNSSSPDLYFSNNAGTTRVTLTDAGNVGIGTTSPASKLEVNGSFGTVTSGIYLEYNSGILYHSGGSGNYYQYISGANYLLSNRTATGALVFSTVDTERMRITSAGNVGIGTTSPSTQLNVMTATNAVDVLRLDNSGGNSGSVQGVTHLAINHFGTGTNPSTRITAYQDGVSGWPGGMYFSTRSLNTDSAPVERMRITSAGNVGIGTSSPQYMLDVNGDAQINASGTGPAYAYQPDGAFGLDSLVTSSIENVALGKPDIWLRIHVDGVAFVFPGYQE